MLQKTLKKRPRLPQIHRQKHRRQILVIENTKKVLLEQIGIGSDPLTEYSDKESMTPAKINAGEPTAVKRDPSDQKITSEGQSGTSTAEAQEEYRKCGMTKVGSHSHSDEDSSC